MIFIRGIQTDPSFNLAFEEYILSTAKPGNRYFLLWQNDNAIIIGKHQNTVEEINQEYVDAHGIRVVRRPTGGGAVFHDLGNINFTFIQEQQDVKHFDFKSFTKPIIEMLQEMGVDAAFNDRNDLTIEGRKFSGNSQLVKHGWVMHHGTLLFNADLDRVNDALRVNEDKIKSKGIKSVRSRVTNIIEHLPKQMTVEEFKQALYDYMCAHYDIEEMTLTQDDIAKVEAIRDSKYGTWEWNYGASPEYDLRKDRKFEGGMVSIRMHVEHGTIAGIKFYGDFFGNGEISDLEKALIGERVEINSLVQALKREGFDYYIAGVPAEQLAELIAR